MRRVCAACTILVLLALPVQALALCLVEQSECCNGAMCPMHRSAAQGSLCDMDMNDQNAHIQRCPAPTVQYTVALTFVLVASTKVAFEPVFEASLLVSSLRTKNIDLDIVAPPPRGIRA